MDDSKATHWSREDRDMSWTAWKQRFVLIWLSLHYHMVDITYGIKEIMITFSKTAIELLLWSFINWLTLSDNLSSFIFFASLFLSFVYSESFLCFVFLDLYSDLTVKEKFGSHFGSIIEGEHLDGLYDDWTVEYDVETSLPLDDETHECVILGYGLLQGRRPHLTYSFVYSWNSSSAGDIFHSDVP